MFIKIKAQSSDLEKQYIKERDIFKKKSKGPKFLLSGLLVATVGGYFYYLNSGNPLQTNNASIASSETEQDIITVENSVISTDAQPENKSHLITDALASDDSERIETTEESTDIIISDSIEDDNFSVQTDDILAESSTELANKAEDSNSEDLIADVNTAEQETESLVASTDADIENEIDVEELIQEEQIEVVESEYLLANDSENNISSTSIPDIEEPIITEADIAQIEAEESIAENSEDIQPTEDEVALENLQSSSIESELSSNNASEPYEEIEIIKVDGEQSQAAKVAITEITLESPKDEEVSTLATESEIADVGESETIAADKVELASLGESDENVSTEDTLEDELLSGVVDENSISVEEELSLEITDQSIAALEPEPKTASTVDKVKESRPIKAISNMISNVFARGNDDEQELIADIIEIDFSKVTNPEQGQERIAIVTVTDSDDPVAYQGNSIEELTQSNYESIDTAALDVAKVTTTFEVSETEVNEIIEKEKQLNTSIDSSSVAEKIESLFEGVDSVAAISIPNITSLVNKSETPETSSAKTEQSKTDKKQKKLSSAADVVKVETVEVAKIEPKTIKNTNQPTTKSNKTDTVAAATSTDIEPAINENKSTITIKDLYDQLMTDLDQKKTVSADKEPIIDQSNKKITVKQIYEQIAKPSDVEQAAVAIEKTKIITELPPEENNTDVELKIDPDKSLAMADPIDSNVPLDSVEGIIIDNIDNANLAKEDETLVENEIETASINTKQLTDNKGSTPLMIAALNADLQTVRELVQQGAQINKRNDWGWTALLNATVKGNQPLVEYLLRNGASPHLADKDGRSPLMAAVHNNHPEIVKTLLNNSADVNKANRDGWTALSFAAWKGNAASVKYLLQANAFKQHRTSEGLTPLQLARQGGHTEVINLLSL